MEHTELNTKLKKIKLFKSLDVDFFNKFTPNLSIIHYNHGHEIITEGDAGGDMYLLLDGTVRVVKKTMSGEHYTAAILKSENGIFFGEVGLLSEEKRSASVIAESRCELAKLNSQRFNEFIEQYPEYGVKILRELSISICQKLQKSNHDMIVLYEALIGEIGHSFL